MSNFDYKNYAVRQFRIWAIIFGAWTSIVILGLVVKYGNIVDRNVKEVIIFAALAAGAVLIMGLYTSFVAWFEKKLFQYKKKIDDNARNLP